MYSFILFLAFKLLWISSSLDGVDKRIKAITPKHSNALIDFRTRTLFVCGCGKMRGKSTYGFGLVYLLLPLLHAFLSLFNHSMLGMYVCTQTQFVTVVAQFFTLACCCSANRKTAPKRRVIGLTQNYRFKPISRHFYDPIDLCLLFFHYFDYLLC